MLGRTMLLAAVLGASADTRAQTCSYTWDPQPGQPGINFSNYTSDAVRWDPDGDGPQSARIVVVGSFGQAGGSAAVSIAQWNLSTQSWSELGGGLRRNGGWASVNALAVLPDNSLVAGGLINQAGTPSVPVQGIARYDGSTWTTFAPGVGGQIFDMLVLPNGHLVIAGDRTTVQGIPGGGVMAWNGSSWYSLQSPLDFNGSVITHLVPTANGGFIATGNFFSFQSPLYECVIRWSPSAQPQGTWSDVGGGMPSQYGVNGAVELDNGEIVVAGDLRWDQNQVDFVARWDGTAWQHMQAGIDRRPSCITELPGGGMFIGTGGDSGIQGGCSTVCHLYDWTGSAWEIEAYVCSNYVGFLNVMSDGDIIAGGIFHQFNDYVLNQNGQVIGGTLYNVGKVMRLDADSPQITEQPASLVGPRAGPHAFHVAALGAVNFHWQRRSSANTWIDLVDGVNTEAATASTLTAAGTQTDTLEIGSINLGSASPQIELRARVDNGCGISYSEVATLTIDTTIAAFCSGDGSLATACPCANFGLAGRGCGNSVVTGGALLAASGSSSPDSVELTLTDVPPGVTTIFLQGDAINSSGVVFGDGVRCAVGQLTRLGARTDSDLDGSTSFGPSFGDAQLSVAGGVIPGSSYAYQTYYRNPNAGWCPPATFNVSNGIEIDWPL